METLPARASRPVPPSLVDDRGRPCVGSYRGAIGELNLDALARPFHAGALSRFFREKRWAYLTVSSPELVLGLAVLDMRYLGSAFFYLYDRTSGRLFEFTHLSPLALGARFEGSPDRGSVSFWSPGASVRIDTDGETGHRQVSVSSRGRRAAVDLNLEIRGDEGAQATVPINAVEPIPPYGLVYAHRSGPLKAAGQVVIDGRARPLTVERTTAALQWTWALHAHRTNWKWAGAGGKSADGGRDVGFNLVRGYRDLGESENFVWFDGQPSPVGRIDFDLGDYRLDTVWRIGSEDGRVDLAFHPEAIRAGDRSAGIIHVVFHQPVGRFEGTLIDDEGRSVEVSDLPGFLADYHLRW